MNLIKTSKLISCFIKKTKANYSLQTNKIAYEDDY